jgi:hypothetical protein
MALQPDDLTPRPQTAKDWKDNLEFQRDIEIRLNTLAQEQKGLADRIPEKFPEQLLKLGFAIEQLTKDVKSLGEDLKADYVSRAEFVVLKTEHDKMKKLIWGFVIMVLVAVVGAVIALAVKGTP